MRWTSHVCCVWRQYLDQIHQISRLQILSLFSVSQQISKTRPLNQYSQKPHFCFWSDFSHLVLFWDTHKCLASKRTEARFIWLLCVYGFKRCPTFFVTSVLKVVRNRVGIGYVLPHPITYLAHFLAHRSLLILTYLKVFCLSTLLFHWVLVSRLLPIHAWYLYCKTVPVNSFYGTISHRQF